MTKPMKVRLMFAVEVDYDAWSDEYGWKGSPMSRREVRDDVAQYVLTMIREGNPEDKDLVMSAELALH